MKEDPDIPLAMAAYRTLNEVVKRSKGASHKWSLVQAIGGIRYYANSVTCFIETEETAHGLIVELGDATDHLVKASSNISLKSVAQIYMFFITGASRNFTVRTGQQNWALIGATHV